MSMSEESQNDGDLSAKDDGLSSKGDELSAKDVSLSSKDVSLSAKGVSLSAKDGDLSIKGGDIVAKDCNSSAKDDGSSPKDDDRSSGVVGDLRDSDLSRLHISDVDSRSSPVQNGPAVVGPAVVHQPALNGSAAGEETVNVQNVQHDPAISSDSTLEISYESYSSELQMPDIMRLIQADLSEPYSIYTYRYFIHNWPNLCFLARHGQRCVGAIVCKLDYHKKITKRGYIAMLAVDEHYRKRKIGGTLVKKAIEAMIEDTVDEVVLETEVTNKAALLLYERLGFVRDKRLFRYYLNGVDALRLKLWLR